MTQGHDRREIDEALVAQRRFQLGRGLRLGLRRDRAEQAQPVLRQQLHGSFGQGVALVDPELPADVRVHVLGVEADRLQHTDRFG